MLKLSLSADNTQGSGGCMSAQDRILVSDLALDYANNKRTGCLEVQYGLLRGEIHFQFGLIIQAEYQGKKGTAALYELVQLENAHVLWHEGLMPMYVSMSVDLADVIRDLEQARQPVAHIPNHNGTDMGDAEAEPRPAKPHVPHEPKTLHVQEGANAEREEYDSSLAKSYLMELTWLDCPRPGHPDTFLLEDDHQACYLVGRSPRCQIVIDDPSVESIHCSLLVHDQSLEVWDVGTDHLTSLNGRVIEMGTLDVGDVLTLGQVSLKFGLLLRRSHHDAVAHAENSRALLVSSGKRPAGPITFNGLDHGAGHHKKNHDGAIHHLFSNLFHKKSSASVLASRNLKLVPEENLRP